MGIEVRIAFGNQKTLSNLTFLTYCCPSIMHVKFERDGVCQVHCDHIQPMNLACSIPPDLVGSHRREKLIGREPENNVRPVTFRRRIARYRMQDSHRIAFYLGEMEIWCMRSSMRPQVEY